MSQTTITKVGAASAGYVGEVAISSLVYEMPQPAESGAWSPYPENRQFATAIRDSNNNLKVIIWESSDGVITRLTDGSGGGASQIAVAGLNSANLVTAFRSASGDLALILLDYQPSFHRSFRSFRLPSLSLGHCLRWRNERPDCGG